MAEKELNEIEHQMSLVKTTLDQSLKVEAGLTEKIICLSSSTFDAGSLNQLLKIFERKA